MTREKALENLSYHSGRNPDFNNSRWKQGYLGVLKPFKGELKDDNFIEIMESLKALQSEFGNDMVNCEMIADLWGIQYYATMWVQEGGILDNLLSKEQKELVNKWTGIISYSVVCLLEKSPEAFLEYEDYINEK